MLPTADGKYALRSGRQGPRHVKSRSGCRMCKIKRIKCDEDIPNCKNCVKKGLECPGYEVVFRWSTRHETSRPRQTPKGRIMEQRLPSTEQAQSIATWISPYCHVPKTLKHDESALVEYYFRHVCCLYSSFDSAMNPFRTMVAQLWPSSSPIYFAIQSMAAALLANHIPRMKAVGLDMQRQAYNSLRHEILLSHPNSNGQLNDKLLLAVLLLGMTTSWHNTSDLGEAHLQVARACVRARQIPSGYQGPQQLLHNDRFFNEALIYWDMVTSFMLDEPYNLNSEVAVSGIAFGCCELPKEKGKLVPHPWTGVAPREQVLFSRVGRLVRHICALKSDGAGGDTLEDSREEEFEAVVKAATVLEEDLLSISTPKAELLVDVQDKKTPIGDFIKLAEATRCAGLLLIYRVFPSLLAARLGFNDNTTSCVFQTIPIYTQESALEPGVDNATKSWLTSMAIHIVNLLANTANKSGTRPFQLLLLLLTAVELNFEAPCDTNSPPGSAFNNLEVAKARDSAMVMLETLISAVPSKPVVRAIELVKEVWKRNDGGDYVFWIDLMISRQWESIMG